MKYFQLSAICAKSEMKSINLHSSRVFIFFFFLYGNTHALQCDKNKFMNKSEIPASEIMREANCVGLCQRVQKKLKIH